MQGLAGFPQQLRAPLRLRRRVVGVRHPARARHAADHPLPPTAVQGVEGHYAAAVCGDGVRRGRVGADQDAAGHAGRRGTGGHRARHPDGRQGRAKIYFRANGQGRIFPWHTSKPELQHSGSHTVPGGGVPEHPDGATVAQPAQRRRGDHEPHLRGGCRGNGAGVSRVNHVPSRRNRRLRAGDLPSLGERSKGKGASQEGANLGHEGQPQLFGE
mmetsp:Transcript_3865/g.6614  ORF Transcript_3865/g.6614 Transcript_3865/m.6614 type:complete len:214 (-) Transcript_3865:697-1338(-)